MELRKYGIPSRNDNHHKNRIGILCTKAALQPAICSSRRSTRDQNVNQAIDGYSNNCMPD